MCWARRASSWKARRAAAVCCGAQERARSRSWVPGACQLRPQRPSACRSRRRQHAAAALLRARPPCCACAGACRPGRPGHGLVPAGRRPERGAARPCCAARQHAQRAGRARVGQGEARGAPPLQLPAWGAAAAAPGGSCRGGAAGELAPPCCRRCCGHHGAPLLHPTGARRQHAAGPRAAPQAHRLGDGLPWPVQCACSAATRV